MRGQPDRLRRVHLPAPTGGINTISAGTAMPPTDLAYCYNMIGAEFGLRTRLGWFEWCTGLGGEQVRSLLAFTGSTSANSRLFACTQSGIWDVTSSTATPTKVVTFGTQNLDSGWGNSTVFVNAAFNHFLVYCDEANGVYTYAETGSVWTQGGISGTAITGVDPTKLVFVMPWKNRLWFVEKDTAKGWYLPLNTVAGAATAFTFGSRFKAGGDLRGLYSWTFDGGSGIDDALVAISSGGDVVIYRGTDPASASTFAIQGVWFLGGIPAYRRICTDFGGDLIAMSSTGIVPMSKLVIGNVLYDRSQYQTQKVANLWNQLQASTASMRGWSMCLNPKDAALIVTIPTAAGQPTQQLAMSLSTRGWHQYRDMPMGVSTAVYNGQLYFGTEDGRVCVNDGYVDGTTLAAPTAFSAIGWSMLTAFSALGSSNFKKVEAIATSVLSQGGTVLHNAVARYDWNMVEPDAPVGVSQTGGSTWDVSLWGVGTWAGAYQPIKKVFGASGIGRYIALAIRGESTYRMTLTDLEVAYTEGGLL